MYCISEALQKPLEVSFFNLADLIVSAGLVRSTAGWIAAQQPFFLNGSIALNIDNFPKRNSTKPPRSILKKKLSGLIMHIQGFTKHLKTNVPPSSTLDITQDGDEIHDDDPNDNSDDGSNDEASSNESECLETNSLQTKYCKNLTEYNLSLYSLLDLYEDKRMAS
ncbi:11879_t:CDS:2, partial [Funneliformis caledonium]